MNTTINNPSFAWVNRHLKGDPILWGIVLVLSIISLFVVYSATGTLAYKKLSGNTEYFLFKHGGLIILGLFCMWAAHRIDYKYYSKLSLLALFASVPLLIFTWKFGSNINDASRWITIPIINQTFQPSDLAKLALISHLARMLSKRQHHIKDNWRTLIPICLWCGVICGLIVLTNVSTGALLFITCLLLMFIGRVPFKYLAMLVAIGILCGSLAMAFGQRSGTAFSRIQKFMDPTEVSYQVEQGYIAIATGEVFGKGPGNSDQRYFLPSPFSDFIFAIILEEYGFIGGVTVLFLYLAFLYRGLVTVSKSLGAFGGLLSAGLCFSLVLQAMINMGVAVGLGPVTGQPLPLLSMGGTSLIFTGISIGIILSVSRSYVEEQQKAAISPPPVNAPAHAAS